MDAFQAKAVACSLSRSNALGSIVPFASVFKGMTPKLQSNGGFFLNTSGEKIASMSRCRWSCFKYK